MIIATTGNSSTVSAEANTSDLNMPTYQEEIQIEQAKQVSWHLIKTSSSALHLRA